MKLNVKSLHIGRAIAECLTTDHALNKFFRGDCIADILNQTAGLEGKAALSAESIAKAFKGDGGDNYTIDYNDEVELNLSEAVGVGQNDILCVFRMERSDRNDKNNKRYAIVGRFESEEKMEAAYNKSIIVTRYTTSSQYSLSDATKTTLQSKLNRKRVYSNDKQPQKPSESKRTKQTSNREQAASSGVQGGANETEEDRNALQCEVNIRRLEEKCNLARKAHDAAMASEHKARHELRGALAELNAARNQLKSDTSLPQDEMNVEPTDTQHLSPPTADEEDDNEDA